MLPENYDRSHTVLVPKVSTNQFVGQRLFVDSATTIVRVLHRAIGQPTTAQGRIYSLTGKLFPSLLGSHCFWTKLGIHFLATRVVANIC